MRKIILTLLSVLLLMCSQAQEKGLHLTLAGNLGASKLGYTTDTKVKSNFNLGYSGTLGVQYFFNYHWGLAAGVGISYYKTSAKLQNNYSFENMTDADVFFPDGKYTLNVGLKDWTELQKNYFLEIPVMAVYQTKWGLKEIFGLYFAVGVKMQLPIIKKSYEVKQGTQDQGSQLFVEGYYPDYDMTIDDVPDYGFGNTRELDFKGKMDIKFGVAAAAELGFLFKLAPRADLSIGAYADYGFLNIKKGNKSENGYLIAPENEGNTIHPSSFVGDKLQYNGVVNSSAVNKVNPLSVGLKVGIRVKIGKLREKSKLEEHEENQAKAKAQTDSANLGKIEESLNTIIGLLGENAKSKDTIIVNTNLPEYFRSMGLLGEPGSATKQQQEVAKEHIFFDLNKALLSPASKMVLDRKVKLLNDNPNIRLRIIGNTCNLGEDQLNMNLGMRRANVARNYMISKGIPANRIITASQGTGDPLAPNDTEENRTFNRRCDFEIDIVK